MTAAETIEVPGPQASLRPDEGLRVEIVDPRSDPRWDAWLASFPAANCFHTSAWARLLTETYGCEATGIALLEAGAATAMAPFFWNRWRLRRRTATCVAFADTCDPLANGSAAFASLRAAAIGCGKARGWHSIEFRGGEAHLPELTASTRFLLHRLDLSGGEARILSGASENTRRNIRKAERSGLHSQVCRTLASVEQYYRLHCATRRRLGSPPQPWRFFANVWEQFVVPGRGFVALVTKADAAIAGVVVLHHGHQAVYKFGASDERELGLRPNQLAMWTAIRHCADLGLREFHFGRTSLHDEGLRRYKKGWGSAESVAAYYRIDLRTGSTIPKPDVAGDWRSAIVRRLPAAVVNTIGSTMYRYLI